MIADLQKQLGIDLSFFYEFGLFVAIYLWLRFFLFAPYLKVLLLRNYQTGGLKDEAHALDQKSQEKEALFAQKIAEARRQALQEREKILVAARANAAVALDEARHEAKSKIEAARTAAEAEANAEFDQLKSQSSGVANLFVEKLLKQKVGL